ncbi:spartin a isoform X2 [Silurus meridionalis]|uniref:spartin a isoform X2 n=1 Tax=Silurus meridionalis TaxID=175797 RepID=UPI001EEA56C6|nr:spartin a isoform X2 [Silurus meridionalis]
METPDPVNIQIIRKHYDKALECLNAGILEDNMGNKDRAIALYRLGRRHLLQGLEMATGQNDAQQVLVKMNKMLSSVTTRLAVLESASATQPSGRDPCLPKSPSMSSDVPLDRPPAYTPQPTDRLTCTLQSKRRTFPSLPTPDMVSHHQDVLFFLPHGVQIFFVPPNGQVSAPSYPGYLCITLNTSQYNNDCNDTRHPLAYLQTCQSCLVTLMAAVPGSCVGVVLSSEISAVDRSLFQEHLSIFTQLSIQSAEYNRADEATGRNINQNTQTLISPSNDTASGKEKNLPKWSEKMSQSITSGASWLSRGLLQGGDATGKAIQSGAVKLRNHMTPKETPAEVSPRVITGLHVAQQATGGAVKVSHFLVNGLSTVVGLVAKEITPHAKKHGSKLVPASLKSNNDACTKLNGVKVVATSSLKGLSTVWTGMETAAKTVGKSASSETVLTVKHKYGNQAGQAANSAVQSAINVGVTAFTLDNIGLKAVLKCAGNQMSSSSTAEDQTMNPEKKAKGEICEKK